MIPFALALVCANTGRPIAAHALLLWSLVCAAVQVRPHATPNPSLSTT